MRVIIAQSLEKRERVRLNLHVEPGSVLAVGTNVPATGSLQTCAVLRVARVELARLVARA
jgi:hypothetical protein